MRRSTTGWWIVSLSFVFCFGAAAVEAPTVKQLQEKPELLKELYEPAHSISVEEHYFRGYLAPGEAQPEIVPEAFRAEDLYVVRSGDQTVYLKKHAFRRASLSFIPMDAGEAVICLPNPDGGNGWRVNPWFVVQQEPLKLLGQVSGVFDIDGDGEQELVVVDDIWEGGLSQLSHADAPSAAVIYRVENGALVLDGGQTRDWAARKITRLNEEIQELRPDAEAAVKRGESAPPELFSAILAKFLYYRAQNRLEPGWEELRKDLRTFDSETFPIGGFTQPNPVPKTSIKEIEQRVAESLKARGSLEADLKAYTSAPLAVK
ncbi:MAG: hypothetical protein RBU21_00875 [FCB group bacterium]|jgi:hypothetical protein|nr:hypothetical protein [FCB group bacterium]